MFQAIYSSSKRNVSIKKFSSFNYFGKQISISMLN